MDAWTTRPSSWLRDKADKKGITPFENCLVGVGESEDHTDENTAIRHTKASSIRGRISSLIVLLCHNRSRSESHVKDGPTGTFRGPLNSGSCLEPRSTFTSTPALYYEFLGLSYRLHQLQTEQAHRFYQDITDTLREAGVIFSHSAGRSGINVPCPFL
jgi:hypothetical protein